MVNTFRFSPDDLLAKAPSVGESVEKSLPAMTELVRRYGLAGRNLMSVGSGMPVEELAMLRCGMAGALCFDIDESGSLRQTLANAARGDGTIVYVLDDFTKVQPVDLPKVDVLYFSSFTPDELRRGAISRERTARYLAGDGDGDPNWPAGTSPLHESVLKASELYLRDGGIFIVQSYNSGIGVTSNPSYVEDWRETLQSNGISLLEAYHFVSAPGVTLWVGFKWMTVRTRAAMRQLVQELETRPLLTRFHWRAQIDAHGIKRFYTIGQDGKS